MSVQRKKGRSDGSTSETARRIYGTASPIYPPSFYQFGGILSMIYEILPTGEMNARSTKELELACGFSSARKLRSQISKERAEGALILSTCRNGGGYFRPQQGTAGRIEMEAYRRTLEARARHTLAALKFTKKALRNIEGQTSVEELSYNAPVK